MRIQMAAIVALMLFSLAQPAPADQATRADIERFCQREFEQVQKCCLTGSCEVSVGVVDYALILEVEEVRPLRYWCRETRGEVHAQCPGGKFIRQRNYLLLGSEEGEQKDLLTRVLIFSAEEDKPLAKAHEPVLELIRGQQKICLKEIDELLNSKDSTFAKTCDRLTFAPKLQELREKVNFELMGLLVNSDLRKKVKGQYVEPYLKNLVEKSCPVLDKWHGVFATPLYGPETENGDLLEKTVGTLLKEKWGTLTPEAKARLITRECVRSEGQTQACTAQPLPELHEKIPCDGNNHYIAERSHKGPPQKETSPRSTMDR